MKGALLLPMLSLRNGNALRANVSFRAFREVTGYEPIHTEEDMNGEPLSEPIGRSPSSSGPTLRKLKTRSERFVPGDLKTQAHKFTLRPSPGMGRVL